MLLDPTMLTWATLKGKCTRHGPNVRRRRRQLLKRLISILTSYTWDFSLNIDQSEKRFVIAISDSYLDRRSAQIKLETRAKTLSGH
jgi:hypothetical protein